MEVHLVADILDEVEGDPELLQTTITKLLRGNVTEKFRAAVMVWREDHSELFAGESTNVLSHNND